jgi:hypothetical protein
MPRVQSEPRTGRGDVMTCQNSLRSWRSIEETRIAEVRASRSAPGRPCPAEVPRLHAQQSHPQSRRDGLEPSASAAGPPNGRLARRSARLSDRIGSLVRAIQDNDEAKIEEAILRLSRRRRVFAPHRTARLPRIHARRQWSGIRSGAPHIHTRDHGHARSPRRNWRHAHDHLHPQARDHDHRTRARRGPLKSPSRVNPPAAVG